MFSPRSSHVINMGHLGGAFQVGADYDARGAPSIAYPSEAPRAPREPAPAALMRCTLASLKHLIRPCTVCSADFETPMLASRKPANQDDSPTC